MKNQKGRKKNCPRRKIGCTDTGIKERKTHSSVYSE